MHLTQKYFPGTLIGYQHLHKSNNIDIIRRYGLIRAQWCDVMGRRQSVPEALKTQFIWRHFAILGHLNNPEEYG